MQIRTLPTEQYFQIVREQMKLSGEAYVCVSGISMQPMLRHLRDGVILVPPERIRWGDIVLFDRKNGRYALHRVVKKEKHGFCMAGDHQWHMEYGLPYDQIVGVVSHIVRDGRRLSVRRFPLNFYSMIITAAAIPRIYVYKVLRTLYRPLSGFFGRWNIQKKGKNDDQNP